MYPILYCRKQRRKLCTGMILCSVLLRLLTSPAQTDRLIKTAKRAVQKLPVTELVMFFETGVKLTDSRQPLEAPTAPPAPPAPTEPVTSTETESLPETTEFPQPTEAPPETQSLQFTPDEAENISFRGNCTYTVDKEALLAEPLCWTTPQQGPQVLIIHSHTSESYTPSEGYEYEASGDYRTLDSSRSVVAVGDALAQSLEAAGIGVIHDTTCHDSPSYNSSYANARQTIERELEAYPSIVMVIDVHRDAAEEIFRETAEIDGKTAAKLMLVVGTDEGGLSHPFWEENLSCALKLQALANRSYPGLFKSLALRASRFNQDETPASLIVEVGSTGNTLPEALTAADYLGNVIAELLDANR